MTALTDGARVSTPARTRSTGKFSTLLRFEFRLLLRRKVTVASAVFVPVLLVGVMLVRPPADAVQWSRQLGVFLLLAVLITVYVTAVTAITTRRETQVFKRFRTSEVGPFGIVAALILPLAALGVVQIAVVLGGCIALGASLPRNPLLVAAGGGAILVCALALALATATLTAASERAQFTTTPVLLGGAIGAQMVTLAISEEVRLGALLVPLTGGSSLVTRGWGGEDAVPATVRGLDATVVEWSSLLLWTVAAVIVTVRNWRWTPRG